MVAHTTVIPALGMVAHAYISSQYSEAEVGEPYSRPA